MLEKIIKSINATDIIGRLVIMIAMKTRKGTILMVDFLVFVVLD